jgi:hypothetical protein
MARQEMLLGELHHLVGRRIAGDEQGTALFGA